MSREPLRIVILGSTGSIGRQTVEICLAYPERVQVVALAAHSNAELLARQAAQLGREAEKNETEGNVPLSQNESRGRFPLSHFSHAVHTVLASIEGSRAVVELAELQGVDLVLNAMVGAAGLEASYAALRSGKTLALANKESLVVAGDVLMPLVKTGKLLPVDSEHSALFQCLVGESEREIANLWITASGGPFRGRTRSELAAVTREQALAHPNWAMGAKISIDSATLMNKGLEIIEAHHLFGLPYSRIKAVQHPQSCVHSLVEYIDGSFKAHLGVTDMRIPIQYALSYPERWHAAFDASLDLCELGSLDFSRPDAETFGCLRLATVAGQAGGTLPCVLNAANEVAVAAFLENRIGFLDIERVVATCLERHDRADAHSIEQLLAVDAETRRRATEIL